MTEPSDKVPHLPPEEHLKEQQDRAAHLGVLQEADQALSEAQDDIARGRARLQLAMQRYEERAHDPR